MISDKLLDIDTAAMRCKTEYNRKRREALFRAAAKRRDINSQMETLRSEIQAIDLELSVTLEDLYASYAAQIRELNQQRKAARAEAAAQGIRSAADVKQAFGVISDYCEQNDKVAVGFDIDSNTHVFARVTPAKGSEEVCFTEEVEAVMVKEKGGDA